MTYQIKTASPNDLERIAACHRVAFPASLSSALGMKYVKAMLGWYLSNKNTFLFFVESENSGCIGYCGGMVKTVWGVGSASSMTQYSFNAAIVAFLKKPWLIFHREVWGKYPFIVGNIVNRFVRKKKLKDDPDVIFEPYAGLVVIGVDPAFQGKGYGYLLLKEFEKMQQQRGVKKMILSVHTDNGQAIATYARNGWIITDVKGNSTSMEKRLNDQYQPEHGHVLRGRI